MSTFTSDPIELRQASDKLTDGGDRFDHNTKVIMETTRDMMEKGWVSPAGKVVGQKILDSGELLKEMSLTFRSYSDFMTDAAKMTTDNEENIKTTYGKPSFVKPNAPGGSNNINQIQ